MLQQAQIFLVLFAEVQRPAEIFNKAHEPLLVFNLEVAAEREQIHKEQDNIALYRVKLSGENVGSPLFFGQGDQVIYVFDILDHRFGVPNDPEAVGTKEAENLVQALQQVFQHENQADALLVDHELILELLHFQYVGELSHSPGDDSVAMLDGVRKIGYVARVVRFESGLDEFPDHLLNLVHVEP